MVFGKVSEYSDSVFVTVHESENEAFGFITLFGVSVFLAFLAGAFIRRQGDF